MSSAAAPAGAGDTPLVAGPLYGLRTWIAVGEPGHERLAGPQRGEEWPARAPLKAVCGEGRDHDPPGQGCQCGVHAWHPSRAAARRVLRVRGEIAGILAASGPVEVHEGHFRAAEGRVHALVLTPRGNPRLLERLAKTYGAELIRADGPDALLAYCREHDLGLSPAVVEQLVGAERLEAEHRSRRGRTVRMIASFAALLLVIAAIVAAVHPAPQPHGKVIYGRTGKIVVP